METIEVTNAFEMGERDEDYQSLLQPFHIYNFGEKQGSSVYRCRSKAVRGRKRTARASQPPTESMRSREPELVHETTTK